MPRKTISKTKPVKKKVVREARAVYATADNLLSRITIDPNVLQGRAAFAA